MPLTKVDLRQTKEWGNYLATLGWHSVGGIRIHPILFFSVVKVQRSSRLGDKEIKNIIKVARESRALFVKAEPLKEADGLSLMAHGFKKDKWPLCVTKTIILDLTPSLEKLRANFKKDTRYCLRKAESNNLSVSVIPLSSATASNPLASFHSLWQKTARRGHFYIPSLREFQNKCGVLKKKAYLISVSQNNLTIQPFNHLTKLHKETATEKLLAGALVIIEGGVCYYLHAASSREGHQLNAPYLCLWEVIKLAKKKGCKRIDLEGIYDPRFKKATKNWHGFTHFKQGFGGVEHEFPGSFTKYFP